MRCVPAQGSEEAGGVRVLVVPAVRPVGRLEFGDLVPDDDVLESIRSYLDRRRTLGVRMTVEPPFYQGVTVVSRIIARAGTSTETLRARALDALYAFVDPVSGGSGRSGWPFGRTVHVGELYALLQGVPGTELVEDVLLFPADPVTGHRGEPGTRITLAANALPVSYQHQVRVEPGTDEA